MHCRQSAPASWTKSSEWRRLWCPAADGCTCYNISSRVRINQSTHTYTTCLGCADTMTDCREVGQLSTKTESNIRPIDPASPDAEVKLTDLVAPIYTIRWVRSSCSTGSGCDEWCGVATDELLQLAATHGWPSRTDLFASALANLHSCWGQLLKACCLYSVGSNSAGHGAVLCCAAIPFIHRRPCRMCCLRR